MTKSSKIIALCTIVAILMLGVGFAAIQNVTLQITGSAAADPNQANFQVSFSGTPTTSNDTKVAASITNSLNAVMNVTGLTTVGETVSATYTIQNTSADLSAALSATVSNSNTEFFAVSQTIANSVIAAGGATTITVEVELIKTPITNDETSTIGVQITAAPQQPTP